MKEHSQNFNRSECTEDFQKSINMGERSYTIDISKPKLLIKKDQIIISRDASLNCSQREAEYQNFFKQHNSEDYGYMNSEFSQLKELNMDGKCIERSQIEFGESIAQKTEKISYDK